MKAKVLGTSLIAMSALWWVLLVALAQEVVWLLSQTHGK